MNDVDDVTSMTSWDPSATSKPDPRHIATLQPIINHLQATGGLIRGLRPDERSVASRLHDALEAKGFRAGGFTAIFSLNKICWLIYDHVVGILSSNSPSHFRD